MNVGGIAFNSNKLEAGSTDRLMSLFELIKKFNDVTNIEDALGEIGDAAHSFMDAQAVLVLLFDKSRDALQIRYSTGTFKTFNVNKTIPPDRGLAGWVVEHKLPFIANTIDEHTRRELSFASDVDPDFVARNLISAPLLNRDNKLIGILEAYNRLNQPNVTEDDLATFQMLAKYAASTIERVQSQQMQDQQLKQKEMYLTEIHHRVKNDLALISGIVEIESFDVEDEKARGVLSDVQSRIKSMASVYELLSREGSATEAKLDDYFENLVSGIESSFRNDTKNIDVKMNTETIFLDPYKALSCGLILNELLLNSYKHAFNDRDKGQIEIEVSKVDDAVVINYKDDGPGLPENFELSEQDSIGFKMIQALVEQLNGRLEIGEGRGAHFVIRFKIQKSKPTQGALQNA